MPSDPKQNLLSVIEPFGDIGMYARSIRGDRSVAYNQDGLFLTCSCYKVITAIALYQKLEQEGLDDSVMLDYEVGDRVAGSGTLKLMQPHQNSIYNFLVLMLKQSDNTATHLLEEYVGMERQRDVVTQLGLERTQIRLGVRELVNYEMGLPRSAAHTEYDRVCIERDAVSVPDAASVDLSRSNVSTPHELCRVLEELVSPTLISPENAQKVLDIMKQYDPDDRIVEFGRYIEIANKGGWAVGLRADMNIVFSDNPFCLVVMAKNLENEVRNRLVASYNDIILRAIEFFDG